MFRRLMRQGGLEAANLVTVVAMAIGLGAVDGAAQASASESRGLVSVASDADAATTVERARAAIEARDLTVMSVIDHAAAAAEVGMSLEPLTVIVFGNPRVGSRLMACAPEVGIDLPLKLLVWASDGEVRVGYNDPAYLKERHAIRGCDEILERMSDALAGIARSAAGGGGGG